MTELSTGELIKLLQKADPGGRRKVWLQRDSEGNGYEPVYGVWGNAAVNTWGEVGYGKLTKELKDAGYTKEDIKKGRKIVVIQP